MRLLLALVRKHLIVYILGRSVGGDPIGCKQQQTVLRRGDLSFKGRSISRTQITLQGPQVMDLNL